MQVVLYLLRSSWKMVAVAVGSSVLAGISSASLIAITSVALTSSVEDTTARLWMFAGLVIFIFSSKVLSQLLLVRLGQTVLFNLRTHLSRQVANAPLRQLEQIGKARLLAALLDDSSLIGTALVDLPYLCLNVASLIVCVAYLGWLSPLVLIAVLGFIGIGVATYQLLQQRATQHFVQSASERDQLFNHFRALTEGTKEIKLSRERREAFLTVMLEQTAQQYRQQFSRAMNYYSVAESWGQLLSFVVVGLVLFALPQLNIISLTTVSSSILIIFYMRDPLNVIMQMLPDLQRALIAMQQIEALGLSLVDESPQTVDQPRSWSNWHAIHLADLVYSYTSTEDDRVFQLGPINTSMYAGEIVFIVGGNGSGKTTLGKLLAGLYVPDSGAISVDDTVIEDQHREAYRQLFAAVFSDFYLFDELIGVSTPEMIEQATDFLAQLRLSHKVQIVDGKFSTTALSQGQRKRLALLAAYLEQRPIYLFDEWAADQDPEFKAFFYDHLLPSISRLGKMIIVITHDDRYFHVADRIVKLDEGRIVADELVAKPAQP